jgi:hypothetical protein
MIIRPVVLTPTPSVVQMALAGLVGTILLTALGYLAPVAGFPFIDLPHLVGGVLTAHPTAAFWLGYTIAFLMAAGVLPLVLFAAWSLLPGSKVTMGGTLLKGVVLGLGAWGLAGLLLPLLAALNQLPGVANPGLFAMNTGLMGMAGLLGPALLYGVSVALVAGMEQGISSLDSVGWDGFSHAAAGVKDLDLHRSGDVPEPAPGRWPRTGES